MWGQFVNVSLRTGKISATLKEEDVSPLSLKKVHLLDPLDLNSSRPVSNTHFGWKRLLARVVATQLQAVCLVLRGLP